MVGLGGGGSDNYGGSARRRCSSGCSTAKRRVGKRFKTPPVTSSARDHLDGERRRNQRIVLLDAAVNVSKTTIVCLLRQSNALLRAHACDRGGVVEAQSRAPRSLR